MRLFVAIPLPGELRESLGRLQDASAAGLKWQDTGQMHLTLRFIGEVTEPAAGAIAGALRTVDVQPFGLTFRGTGAFPGRTESRRHLGRRAAGGASHAAAGGCGGGVPGRRT
ncbi:MAG: RNA 2',3'-cyclic phosphodiesterase [Balneolaceae bacterium]|nr:RNA 2',3'-cyclic phosphodiesterase [Balneolaceae bacterium]